MGVCGLRPGLDESGSCPRLKSEYIRVRHYSTGKGKNRVGRLTPPVARPDAWNMHDAESYVHEPGVGTRPENRRAVPRVNTRGLIAEFGRVIDLSPRGMRLRSHRRWAEGQTRVVRLRIAEHSAEVTARCVWCRSDGLLCCLVGLAFEQIDEGTLRTLEAITQRCEPPAYPSCAA